MPRVAAVTDPLLPLVELPGVAEAVERARHACEELRWHEAYRRRWREVRAEAGLRATRADAALEGARVDLATLRSLATGGAADAEASTLGVVVGALRASAYVEQLMPDLGARAGRTAVPLPQVLARCHTLAGEGWVPDSALGALRTDAPAHDLAGLGASPDAATVAGRVDLLARTVAETRAPALVVVAVVHGELLALRPFAAANGLVARAVARLLSTTLGLDPTGSVLPEVAFAAAPHQYLAAAAGFATGTQHGLAGWIGAMADAVVRGADEARAVADAVLAGSLGDAG